MIYLTWIFTVAYVPLILYCMYQIYKQDGKEWVLWLAACFVFIDVTGSNVKELLEHYKEDKIVKEVRV